MRTESEHWIGFDFVGTIWDIVDTGDGIEYAVTNAPPLFAMGPEMRIWESEIVGVVI